MNRLQEGEQMHKWATDLFPLCRSLTGDGVRKTLSYMQTELPELCIASVPSGTKAFDWTVPDEWTIHDAYIEDDTGAKVVNFKNNNLHVVGYSAPVDEWLELEELDKHLFSIPEQPNAVPYVTSYYASGWGFCLEHSRRSGLRPGRYRAVIRSELKPGFLNYGEFILSGDSKDEVMLSTYICHPSMANNELSGPVVTLALARWLKTLSKRRYTYRLVFVPETIGSIVYLSRNLDHLKSSIKAGFNITCVGDNRCYSYLPSRAGDTLSDRVAMHVLKHLDPGFKRYSWLDRGSDERQYCAPNIDLPIATIMRSKYGEYPEYHTSLDDLALVTPAGLQGGFQALQSALLTIENNFFPRSKVLGEPQLGIRGLYPNLSTGNLSYEVRRMMNLISYSDGHRDLLEIAELLDEPLLDLVPDLNKLIKHDLIEVSIE